jgi:hypothetical protein
MASIQGFLLKKRERLFDVCDMEPVLLRDLKVNLILKKFVLKKKYIFIYLIKKIKSVLGLKNLKMVKKYF